MVYKLQIFLLFIFMFIIIYFNIGVVYYYWGCENQFGGACNYTSIDNLKVTKTNSKFKGEYYIDDKLQKCKVLYVPNYEIIATEYIFVNKNKYYCLEKNYLIYMIECLFNYIIYPMILFVIGFSFFNFYIYFKFRYPELNLNIPQMPYNNEYLDDENNEDNEDENLLFYLEIKENDFSEECSICRCDFIEKKEFVKCICNHNFHKDCINKWIEKKENCPNCPNCRNDLRIISYI